MDSVLTKDERPCEEVVEERLRLYFASLGIRDESVVRQAVVQVRERMGKSPLSDSTGDCVRAGMSEAMSDVQAWIDLLAEPNADSYPYARDLLLWRLRAVLKIHGKLLFSRDREAVPMQAALRLAQSPILPSEVQAVMPCQPLDDIPEVLRATFWRQLQTRVQRAWGSVVQLFTRQRERT